MHDLTRDLGSIFETVTHRDVVTHHVPAGWHPVSCQAGCFLSEVPERDTGPRLQSLAVKEQIPWQGARIQEEQRERSLSLNRGDAERISTRSHLDILGKRLLCREHALEPSPDNSSHHPRIHAPPHQGCCLQTKPPESRWTPDQSQRKLR